MVVTLGQQYNVGEKPIVILYTDIINRHCCFLIFRVLVANPKKLLYTVANPARGLLNREMYTVECVCDTSGLFLPIYIYVCIVNTFSRYDMDQPGVVASPACGHLKKRKGEKLALLLSSFAPQLSAHSPHSRLNVVLTYGIPPI